MPAEYSIHVPEPAPRVKKKSRTSPTSRTLAELRAQGWTAGVVEKFVRFPPPGHLVDLLGFIDIICFGDYVLAIQATSGVNHSSRVAKVREHENLPAVLRSGVTVEVWSWAKQGPRGGRKTWKYRVEAIREAVQPSKEN